MNPDSHLTSGEKNPPTSLYWFQFINFALRPSPAPPKANGRWRSGVLPSQQHTPHRWAQREAWGRKEVFRRVREMDDLILCLIWSHPKAVRHSGILLAEAGLPWGNLDGSSVSSPSQGVDGHGQSHFSFLWVWRYLAMLLQKIWEDCTRQLSQLRDLSSEGPALHVACYQAVTVLTGNWCSWPGSASASALGNITSFSLPT